MSHRDYWTDDYWFNPGVERSRGGRTHSLLFMIDIDVMIY